MAFAGGSLTAEETANENPVARPSLPAKKFPTAVASDDDSATITVSSVRKNEPPSATADTGLGIRFSKAATACGEGSRSQDTNTNQAVSKARDPITGFCSLMMQLFIVYKTRKIDRLISA